MTDRTIYAHQDEVKNAAIASRAPALSKIPKELIDRFVTGPMTRDAVNVASTAFKNALN